MGEKIENAPRDALKIGERRKMRKVFFLKKMNIPRKCFPGLSTLRKERGINNIYHRVIALLQFSKNIIEAIK